MTSFAVAVPTLHFRGLICRGVGWTDTWGPGWEWEVTETGIWKFSTDVGIVVLILCQVDPDVQSLQC